MKSFAKAITEGDYARKRIYAPLQYTVKVMVDGKERTETVFANNPKEAKSQVVSNYSFAVDRGENVIVGEAVFTPLESASAFILVGYCPDTLSYFQALYKEAKKSFPDLKPKDVTCGKVTKSSSVQGFTLISFKVPNKEVKGWDYYTSRLDFYY